MTNLENMFQNYFIYITVTAHISMTQALAWGSEILTKALQRKVLCLQKASHLGHQVTSPGSVFTNHSQDICSSFSPKFTNWNVTQFRIG